MKHILTAAMMAAIFTLFFALTAYAEPTPAPGSDTPTGTEYPTGAAVNPFTPSGSGTVTNYATGEDGKEFYTITAPDDTVFYLVIDRQRSAENVYFLNAVTVDDLLSLAANPTAKPGAAFVHPTPPQNGSVPPTENNPAEPIPAPKQAQGGGNNTGMLIIVLVLAAFGGGAAWYIKIYKPKQQGAGINDEYEPPVEDETDFDAWDDTNENGGDTDLPPWGEIESGADEE